MIPVTEVRVTRVKAEKFIVIQCHRAGSETLNQQILQQLHRCIGYQGQKELLRLFQFSTEYINGFLQEVK